jgi:hypothetical protein
LQQRRTRRFGGMRTSESECAHVGVWILRSDPPTPSSTSLPLLPLPPSPTLSTLPFPPFPLPLPFLLSHSLFPISVMVPCFICIDTNLKLEISRTAWIGTPSCTETSTILAFFCSSNGPPRTLHLYIGTFVLWTGSLNLKPGRQDSNWTIQQCCQLRGSGL